MNSSRCTLPLLILLSLQIYSFASAKDNITAHQILKDPETLVSTNGNYALGFFSPRNSTSRYLGIWYNKVSIKDYVWVANRDKPINDSSGWLRISNDGNLQVLNGQNHTLWSSNVSDQTTPPTARLLDTGDFVLMAGSTIIWQTSEHATDTLLQNLNFTITPKSDPKRVITSWKSPSDPSTGRFYCGTDSFLLPQFVIWDGDSKYFRSGPWNGNNFIGIQNNFVEFINAALVILSNPEDQQIMTAEYAYPSSQYFSNVKLNYKGAITQPFWNPSNESWVISWQAPATRCDLYATCGAFGSCNSLRSDSICSCLKGFEPKNKDEWGNGNWTGGCVRKKGLKCGGDGFWKLANMKIPDNAELVSGMNKDGCRRRCLNNCTCLAYAYDSGIGCMVWSGSLIDVQEFSTSGADLYIRLASSELGSKMKKKTVIAISVAVWTVVGILVIGFGWWLIVRKRGRGEDMKKDMKKDMENKTGRTTNINVENLPVFEYKDLAMATNNFGQSNKLGQGGFGPVYRGKLLDGREIAVKRLSEVSRQGVEEFMNEVTVISKVQHRNLVRLLGCCVEGEDKMLIYEYMPNKSLDAFIFDVAKRQALSWQVISNIIEGICRGLLYLHRDSRVKIIHRDLKASNVLLDKDLNPKISDFGMARIFWVNQDHDSTRRIVGTYGYMSPEYAMEGRISEKSDVYSFGVLVIEIITGLQNNKFLDADEDLTLMGYAWKLWKEGKIESLIDQRVLDPRPQMVKCLHVGLLCVQEFVVDRPSFTAVMAMLNDEITNLPKPRQPGFMLRHNISDSGISQRPSSINDVSITEMDGR